MSGLKFVAFAVSAILFVAAGAQPIELSPLKLRLGGIGQESCPIDTLESARSYNIIDEILQLFP